MKRFIKLLHAKITVFEEKNKRKTGKFKKNKVKAKFKLIYIKNNRNKQK